MAFPFGNLTPTLTSGINKLCLFNIIGASTLSLNIVLIFKGELSLILFSFSLFIFPPILILGMSIFGPLISNLVSILSFFNFPSMLGIFIFASLSLGIFIPISDSSIFGILTFLSILEEFISIFGIFIFWVLISTLGIWILSSIFEIFCISPFILGISTVETLIFPSILGVLKFSSGDSILGGLISLVVISISGLIISGIFIFSWIFGILIFNFFSISIFWIFVFSSILGEFISTLGTSILGVLIFKLGISILGILIFKFCVFSSFFGILLSIFGISIFDLFMLISSSILGILILGIDILGPFISKLGIL